jgi:glyoxylase-like metal-dependent hydrolase (beta-lactamase superfamily II)
MMTVHTFTFNALQENTYVVFDESKECAIVDPGCYDNEERKELDDFIESNKLIPRLLLNTHCHVDHVLGNFFVSQKYNLAVQTSEIEEAQLRSVKLYAPVYGFASYQESTIGKYLKEGDILMFGKSELSVLFVPGHSPGHLAFLNLEQKICLAGDVLFRNSIGRSDLPGGNYAHLEKSIKTKLYTLPNDITIFPGHGPTTSIGFEKVSNPYVRG